MDSFPSSEMDYADYVLTQNSIDVETLNHPSTHNPQARSFKLDPWVSQPTHGHSIVMSYSNQTPACNQSREPSPSAVILYNTNVLADPDLWDSKFRATSLFGTNKFPQSDVCNMACSLQ